MSVLRSRYAGVAPLYYCAGPRFSIYVNDRFCDFQSKSIKVVCYAKENITNLLSKTKDKEGPQNSLLSAYFEIYGFSIRVYIPNKAPAPSILL